MENQTQSRKQAFILGWNGLKDIIKPGDAVGIASMAHNYKTGTLLSLMSQIARLNKPVNVQPQQKPLVLHFSLEDPLVFTYGRMFHLLKNTFIHNEIYSPVNALFYEKVAYVQQHMGCKGFHYEPVPLNRTTNQRGTIPGLCVSYEKNNCPVEVLAIDGMAQGDVSNAKDHCKEKQITLLTTLELSPDARQLQRSGGINPDDFLDVIAGGGYIVNNADIYLDVVLYVHVIRCKDVSYLAVKVGKRRGIPSDSDQLKTFFMELPSSGVIPDQDPEDGVMFELPSIS